MTTTARLILKDAKRAIDKYTDDLQGPDFRISWIAIITLLRAVGDGLDKVDANISTAMKLAIQAAHKESKSNDMYLFIKGERDRFVHTYEHSVRQTTYGVGTITKADGSTGTFRLYAYSADAIANTTDGRYQSVIVDGPFAGKSGKVVVLQAYQWWLNYLDDVDRRANA